MKTISHELYYNYIDLYQIKYTYILLRITVFLTYCPLITYTLHALISI